MREEKFKASIDRLYAKDNGSKKKLEQEFYSKKGFLQLATCLMDTEKIEAIAPIADNPVGWNKTKTSFAQNWYIILTDKRILFASPTLVLKEPTATAFRYSAITSVSAAKWNSIKMTAQGYVGFLSITGRYLYYEQRDELIRIIENHM